MSNIKELKLVVQTYRRFLDAISALVESSGSRAIDFISSKNQDISFSIFKKDYEIFNSRVIASINFDAKRLVYDSCSTKSSISCRTDLFSIDLQFNDSSRSIFRVEFMERDTVDLFSFLHECMSKDFIQYYGILQFKDINLFISYVSNYIVEEEFKALLLKKYMNSCNTAMQFISERLHNEKVGNFVLDYESHQEYIRPYIKSLIYSYKSGSVIQNSLVFLQSKNKVIYFDEVIPFSKGHLHEICFTKFQESIYNLLDVDDAEHKVIFDVKLLINSILKDLRYTISDYNTLELYRNPDNQYTISNVESCVLGDKNINYDNNSFSLERVGSEWEDFLNNIVYNIFETLSIKSFKIEHADKSYLAIVGDSGLKIRMGFNCNYVDNYLFLRIVGNKRLYLKGYNISKIPGKIRDSYLKNTFMYYLSRRSRKRYIDSASNNSTLVVDMSDYVSSSKFLNFMFDCLAREYDAKRLPKFSAFGLRNFAELTKHYPDKYTKVLLSYYADGDRFISTYKTVLLQISNILNSVDMRDLHLSKIDHVNSEIIISTRDKRVSINKDSLIMINSKYDILLSIIECLGYEDKKDYKTVNELINVMLEYIYSLKCVKLVSQQEIVKVLDHKSLNSDNIYDFVLQQISYSLEKEKLKNFFIKDINVSNKTLTLSSNVYEIILSDEFASYNSNKSIFRYILECLRRSYIIQKSTIYFDNTDSFLDLIRQYKFYCPNLPTDNPSKRMVVMNDYVFSEDAIINILYFELLYNNRLFEIRNFLLEKGLSNFYIHIDNGIIQFISSDRKKVAYIAKVKSDLSNNINVLPFVRSCLKSCFVHGNKRSNWFENIQKFWSLIESRKCMFEGVSLDANVDRKMPCYLSGAGFRKIVDRRGLLFEHVEDSDIKNSSSDAIHYTEYDNSNSFAYYSIPPSNRKNLSQVYSIQEFYGSNSSREIGVNGNSNLILRNLALVFASSLGGLLVLIFFLFCFIYKEYKNSRKKDTSSDLKNITLVKNPIEDKSRVHNV